MSDSSFDDRRQAFEAGFAHKESVEFRQIALRNHKLAAWAAELMGLKGAKADDYIDGVIGAAIDEPGEEAMFRKISRDFDASQTDCTPRTIRRMMKDFMAEAQNEIQKGADKDDS